MIAALPVPRRNQVDGLPRATHVFGAMIETISQIQFAACLSFENRSREPATPAVGGNVLKMYDAPAGAFLNGHTRENYRSL